MGSGISGLGVGILGDVTWQVRQAWQNRFTSASKPGQWKQSRIRWMEDQVVLQCTATVLKEQIKLCLSCEGFGNRLCFLETTSNAQNVPPDLAICAFVLEQSLSVRALQEMLANTVEMNEAVDLDKWVCLMSQ
ncbi:ryanodine receptor 2-like [Sinocyclocheilus grahami]|uniref:ryanodine receptor 2-like n=1 Tax=Sinocyclocheilus grahami TaxID=75366 RepID=UPI0007AC7E8A|nr:PREDICTED: ryanodine receptor 2-like [Sinocyclocheilus grahami]